jgi:hypothetical protein
MGGHGALTPYQAERLGFILDGLASKTKPDEASAFSPVNSPWVGASSFCRVLRKSVCYDMQQQRAAADPC